MGGGLCKYSYKQSPKEARPQLLSACVIHPPPKAAIYLGGCHGEQFLTNAALLALLTGVKHLVVGQPEEFTIAINLSSSNRDSISSWDDTE